MKAYSTEIFLLHVELTEDERDNLVLIISEGASKFPNAPGLERMSQSIIAVLQERE